MRTVGRLVGAILWWSLLVVCIVFGLFAVWMGVLQGLSLTGLSVEAKVRALPVVFVVHAFTGAVALIAGPLQFNRRLRERNRRRHRAIGRLYVVAVWVASVTGLWSAIHFAVDVAAKAAFGAAAVLWFVATTVAFLYARAGVFAVHREWMIRSFALSLFFVTFEFWAGGLESSGMTRAEAYPLGVFLGWFANLSIAEVWIRLSRSLGATARLSSWRRA